MITRWKVHSIVMSQLPIWNSNSLYHKMILIIMKYRETSTVKVKTIITFHKIQPSMEKFRESSVISIQTFLRLMRTHWLIHLTKSIWVSLMGVELIIIISLRLLSHSRMIKIYNTRFMEVTQFMLINILGC